MIDYDPEFDGEFDELPVRGLQRRKVEYNDSKTHSDLPMF